MEEKDKKKFVIKSKYKPTGDQPQAIERLVQGLEDGLKTQVSKLFPEYARQLKQRGKTKKYLLKSVE